MAFLQTSPEAEGNSLRRCVCHASVLLHRNIVPRFTRACSFSLLQLQAHETYFEDFSVQFFPPDMPEHDALQRALRGRLKICSQSVIYDPQDPRFPLLRVRRAEHVLMIY